MPAWLVKLAITFALRQLAKFGDTVNWDTVKADAAARIKDLVPGTFFDDEATAIVNAAVDAVAAACGESEAIASIIGKVVAADWTGALEDLKDLVIKVWQPSTPAEQKVYSHLALAAV